MAIPQEQAALVGQDITTPPQNPVPAPAYQSDPFAGAQQFTSADPNRRQVAGGFRQKPQKLYQSDPLATEVAADNPFRSARENIEAFGTAEQLDRFDRDEKDKNYYNKKQTRLEKYQEDKEVTTENIADIYSLKEDELGDYGIDISAENVGEAPEGIVSGWNDADGDGYDDDGHAMGTHGAVNVRTKFGEQSIQDVLAAADAPLAERSMWEKVKGGIDWGLDKADAYAQPGQKLAGWGDSFTTSPGGAISAALPGPIGGIAAIGGAISKRNLENIYSEHGEYNTNTGMGVVPKEKIPGVTTPLAVSPAPIGGGSGWTVISGNTDLAMQQNPQLDINGDGQLTATELQDYMGQQERLEQAKKIEDQRLRAEAEKAAAAAKAAEERRQAEERSREEARQQEAARHAEAQRRANESGREQTYGGGSAVTDRHGRAVRDSRGQAVTDRMVTVQPQRESSGGGGGGGDSCFAEGTKFYTTEGLKNIEDIKVGDKMQLGGRVYGILQGDGTLEDWYDYLGVHVTGSHFVYEDGRWITVEDSKQAVLLPDGHDTWYCVLNVNHQMLSENELLFTDFDAVDSVNKELEVRLNERR